MDGRKRGDDIAERLVNFAVKIIKLTSLLPNTAVGKHVAGQILRSGTSPGANYEEARGAESRADFVHKLGIVLKELKETRYWIRIIYLSKLIREEHTDLLIREVEELCAIIASSIITTKETK